MMLSYNHTHDLPVSTRIIGEEESNSETNNNNSSAQIIVINDNEKIKEQPKKELTCDDIQNLQIVRKIGNGVNKVAFEVKLNQSNNNTWRVDNVNTFLAKRCYTHKCYKRLFIRNEAVIFKGLQDQYGSDNTVRFLGYCAAPVSKSIMQQLTKAENDGNTNNNNSVIIDEMSRNFSFGETIVLELGKALIPTNNNFLNKRDLKTCYTTRRKCIASHFTRLDIEDFKTIARQYANYSKLPLVLRNIVRHNTDNCKAEQYIITMQDKIRHIDLDMVYLCKDDRNCTYEKALEVNCSVLRILLNNQTIDCNTPTIPTAAAIDYHINTTKVIEQC